MKQWQKSVVGLVWRNGSKDFSLNEESQQERWSEDSAVTHMNTDRVGGALIYRD